RGRIYRIVPAAASPLRSLAPLPTEAAERVALLEHPNGWQRDTAQRLLVEAGDATVLPALEAIFRRSPLAQGRLHALWTIEGLNRLSAAHVQAALQDPEPGVVENALWLAPRFIRSHEAIQRSVLALADHPVGRLRFAALLALGELNSPAAAAAL